MGKRKRYTKAFKREVVLMMKHCANVPKLARELNLYKNQLYKWRLEIEGPPEEAEPGPGRAADPRPVAELRLRAENLRLKQALAEKGLQLDFFKSALRRVEQDSRSQNSGGPAFTPKSGPERSSKAD
ncbi:MAG TPA: transposase [Candidatus Saccharimonadales bacterium]|nr:transposase [Candidatus Saccharimonadales bacterium]